MGFDVKKYSEERKKGTVNAVPENKENSSFDVASYAKQRKENNWNSKGVNSKSVNDFAKDMKVLRENISNGNHFSADKYKSALDLEAQYDYAGSRINKHIDDAYKYKTAISEDTGYYDSLYGQGSAARDQQTVDETLRLLHSAAADLENRKNVEFPKAVEYYDSLNPEMRVTKDTVVPIDEFGGKSTDIKFFETDDSMRKGGFIDNTWNSLLRGFYSSKYGTERYKEMQGQANEAEKYRKALEDDKFQFKSSGFGGAVSGAAELLGQMIYQTTNPRSTAYGAGMAGMAALAGNAGPQAIIPEEIITVPSAFAVGTAMGGALANYEIMASYAYDEMLEYGIDENTAKTVAYVTGGLNALIESAQIDEILSAFKVLNKVDGAASQSLAKIIAKELAERGVDIAKETGEEMLQETVTMGGVDWALRQNGQDGFSAEDYAQRIGETGVQSALSFGVMNMPAAGVNTYRAARGGNIPQGNGVISDENAAKMQGKNDFSVENNEKEQNTEEILQALAEEMQQETVVEIDSDTGEIVADNAEEIVQQVENSAVIENADVESQDADLEAYAQQVADEIIAEFDLARSNSESANKEQASSFTENEMPENGKFEAVEEPADVVENGVDFVKRAAQEIGLGAKGIETAASAFENAPADRVYNSADFVKSFTAMYNDGKNGKPFGTSLKVTNVLNDRHLKMAYNAGLMDAITENSNTKQKRPAKVVRDKTKIIKRAKKSDWSSTDTTWYAPNEKTGKETIIAYSTTATSDLISVLAAENIDATISEIKDFVNYDVEAKKVLQAYIDSGFGQTKASDFFGKYVSLTKTLQEETAQGKIEEETYINENTENVEDESYGQELSETQGNSGTDKQNEQALRTSGTDRTDGTDARTEGRSGTVEEGNAGRASQNTSKTEERIRKTKDKEYRYNEVDFDIASENARAVAKEVERLGLPAYIYEGDIYIDGVLYVDEYGKPKHPQGRSCDGEFVLVKNGTEVPWRELAAHEISHAYETIGLKEAVVYLDAVKDNFIISSDKGSKIIEEIYENNYQNIYGEIAAQISGWLHDDIDINKLSDVLINVDEVVDTHKKFIATVTVKENVENGTEETVSEISDRGRILEPDTAGQMAGGLLDGVSSEIVSENEKSGNVDDVTERNGRNPERDAGRNDNTGLDDLGNQRLSERDDLSDTARGIDKNPVYETSDTGFEVEDIDYVEWQQKKDAAAQKYSLSDEENTCLDAYVAGKAYELNSILRGEDQYESTIITNYYIENCINALNKFPKFKGRTYRNVDLNNKQSFDEFMKEYSQGKTVEFVAFSSASKDPNGYVMSGEYAVHLVIDGVSGCDISGSFSTPKQQEVIYLPGTKVVVDKIETANDGSPVIYVREESENGKNFGTDTADVGEDRQRVETSGNNSGKTSAGYDSAESRAEENRDDVLGIYDDREKQGDISEKSERPLDKSENVENKAPLKAETAKEQIQQKADIATQEKPAGNNFVIAEKGGVKVPTTPKARFKANVDAIKTMRNVMAENRVATPAEQEILAKYTGWGGVSQAFEANNGDWSKEYKQLKNLLTDEEYKTASRSILDAYYTEPAIIRAMYKGLEKIGFKGGRMLEPSAGTGRFIGAMPESMLGNVKSWTAVELDNITGNIAKLLYPNADVRVQGFEKANIPDNYMDLVIGNVPFGNFGVSDSRYPKGLTSLIHNYFIAKSIDKVRPGGIVAVITSKGTMDADNTAARAYLARQADLIGAIRLPNNAFETTGTPVVSDILVFKKREANTPYKGEPFVATERVSGDGYWGVMNEYFAKHPDMILGKPETKYGRYGAEITVNPLDSRYSLATQIERAFAKINATMDYPAVQSQEQIIAEIKAANSKLKNGTVIKKDGKFYTNKDGVLEENKVDAKDSGRLTGIIDIRETARELLQLQLEDAEDSVIKAKRDQLNSLYDGFVKKHGPLNSDKNKRLYKNDVDKPFIQALENVDKDSGVVTKATIFKKNTVSPIKQVTHADSVSEGLTVVLNELGRIDVNRIAQLTGESVHSVEKQLVDTDLAYYDRYGNLEQAQTYLSGNVRAKLRDAKALAEGDKRYERNVKALSKIIPKDIAPEDIKVRPGATWIPDDVYSQFACEMLGGKKNWRDQWDIEVKYNNTLGKYFVEINDNWLKNRPANTKEWGTDERPFIGNENNSLLVAALNNKQVAVYDTMPDKSRVLNKDATRAAQEKLAKILTEFESWLWKDEKRRKELGALYNEVFNNTVTPKYDGSKLTIDGITPDPNMQMRPHQLNAVQRIINSGGNTLLAHRVGAGKTYEMAAAAMKLRQLGVVKKPVFIAPNHLVAQWGKEFLSYFPAAKILVVEKNDFSAANRKLFANRIATGDWDAVIMSYEQFEAVPMSQQAQEEFFQSQIDNLEQAIIEAKRAKNGKDPSVRDMERSKASFEKKLNDLADKTKKDKDNISFEEMGIDALFVDEAHNFKNLFYTTKMTGVSDLGNKEGSGRAFDLYMKTRYLQKLNGGRGIVFATATPVMNSVVEMYTMQRYLQPDLLEAKGLATFDAWANQFGEIAEIERYKADGSGLETKRSLSKYKNLAELQQMFRSFADVIVDAADLPYLKIPKMRTGKRIVIECEAGEYQKSFMQELGERAKKLTGAGKGKGDDHIFKIMGEGKMISYTQKMLEPGMEYEADGKVISAVNNVYNIWKDTKTFTDKDGNVQGNGTQLIFCDRGVPGGTDAARGINIYADMKNMLIGLGVPAKEIAFIHDADSDAKKAELFKDINEGKVRILIGSYGKMSTGMNVQRRITAIHELNVPPRPGDMEQSEGRGLRQGNLNDDVAIYAYVTKGTYDAPDWDRLKRKATFINQVMAGEYAGREAEGDGEFAASAAEIAAIASGNPLIQEQHKVHEEIERLRSLQRAHGKSVVDAQMQAKRLTEELKQLKDFAQRYEQDAAAVTDTSGKKFSIVIDGKTYTERKAAGEALIAKAKSVARADNVEHNTEIGTFAGLKLLVTSKGDMLLKGKAQYRRTVNMESAIGTIQILEAAPKSVANLAAETKARISEAEKAIPQLEAAAKKPFEHTAKMQELVARENEIRALLSADDKKASENVSSAESEEQYSIVPTDNTDQWKAERVKGKQSAAKPLTEIIAKASHDLGIHVTSGHVRGAGVTGVFNPRHKGVRVRKTNDLPAIAHEFGHALDDRYGIVANIPKDVKQELLDNYPAELKDLYPEKEQPFEAVAEFVRKYLQNSEDAMLKYPKFAPYFLNSLSATDRAAFEQFADEVNAYFAAEAETATGAIRLREEKAPDYRTVIEKIEDKANVFRQAWVDAYHGIKRFDMALGSNVYRKAVNAAYAQNKAANILERDLTDIHGKVIGPGLKTALQGVNLRNTYEYRLFGEYLVVKHGPERLKEGMDVFADPRQNNAVWMAKRQKELEQQYPAFKQASERLYQFIADFHKAWGVDTDIISQEKLDSWQKRWEYYVPFNRAFMDGQTAGAKRGFANQHDPYKRAKGSTRDFVHPVDNIIDNVIKMVNISERNNVALSLADAARDLGADAGFIEKIPTPMVAKHYSMAKVKEELNDKVLGEFAAGNIDADSFDAVNELVSGIDDVLTQYSNGKAHGDIITVLRGGEPEYWKVNDEQLLEGLTTMAPMERNTIMKAIAASTRFITASTTGNNPVWSVFSNAPRDLVTVLVYGKNKNIAKLLRDMGISYINSYRNQFKDGKGLDPLFSEYLAMGGGQTAVYNADTDMAKKVRNKISSTAWQDKLKSTTPLEHLRYFLDAIYFAGGATETAPRFATYKYLRENGMSSDEAFYEAMDVTVNFRRGGNYAKGVNSIIPFFNAGVQGLDKMVRYYLAADVSPDKRKKVMKSRVVTGVAVSVALAALHYAINNYDDEHEKEYEQLSTYTKNNFICIPKGDGKFFCIPKPRDLAVLMSLSERVMEYAIGDNKHAYEEIVQYATDTALPPLVSDLVQYPVEIAHDGLETASINLLADITGSAGLFGVAAQAVANRDFLGRPIVSQSMQYSEGRNKYNQNVSRLAYELGQVLNFSPLLIDHFGENIISFWWNTQASLFPLDENRRDLTFGVANKYLKDNQYSNDLTNWMYDRKEENQIAKNSYPDDMNIAIDYKNDSNMTGFYSRYYSLAKTEKETDRTRNTRQAVLDMIKDYQAACDSEYVTPAQRLVNNVVKTTGDTSYLPGVMNDYIKDASETKHSLTSTQYYEYQTAYLGNYWNYVEQNVSNSMATAEKAAYIKAAKTVAKERADETILGKQGMSSGHFDDYSGISDDDLISFKAQTDIANDDGSLKQEEIVDILVLMVNDGLSFEDAYTLFHSKYDSDKNNPWKAYK